eukprot:5047722-Prymnesium_polylepis.3
MTQANAACTSGVAHSACTMAGGPVLPRARGAHSGRGMDRGSSALGSSIVTTRAGLAAYLQ